MTTATETKKAPTSFEIIKGKGLAAIAALAAAWIVKDDAGNVDTTKSIAVTDDAGKVNVTDTRRVLNYALRAHLRDRGELGKPGRKAGANAPQYDAVNVSKAAYYAFLTNVPATANPPEMPLNDLCIAGAIALQAKPADFMKVQKAVREVILSTDSPFKTIAGEGKFSKVMTQLKAAPTKPEAFVAWGTPATPPPAAAPAPAAPPASAPTGKPKKAGKA